METTQKIWKPNSKKQEFLLSLPDTVFEAIYGGAAGGGKTELLMMLPLVRGFIEHPRFKGIFFRRTFPELEKEVIIRAGDYYIPSGATRSDNGKKWTWPSGAVMFFSHLENESDVRKHDTSEYNYIAFDELTSFLKYQYIYLISQRCRSSIPELPAIVRSGTNPGNVGHGWVQKHFHIPNIIGGAQEDEIEPYTIMKDKVTGNLKVFVQALLHDNPNLDQNYGNRLEIMRSVSEAEYQAKKFGRWDVFEGQVFDDFRSEHIPGEPENAVHVIDKPEIYDWYPKILAIDWGFSAMTYACWAAVLPNGRVVIFREYSCVRTKISEWSHEISRISKEIGEIVDVVMCQSAFKDRGDPKKISEQFEEHSELRARPADNERISGKLLLQDFLRWKPKPVQQNIVGTYDGEYAARLMRMQGLDAYNEYLDSFKPAKPEENLPRLLITRDCPILIKTISLCVYDEKNKEDVKEFDGDDPYDCVRYLIKAVDFYIEKSKHETNKRESVGKILARQNDEPDWNRFYMQMRTQESKSRAQGAPIRRFH
jgi:hypothetical protein